MTLKSKKNLQGKFILMKLNKNLIKLNKNLMNNI